MPALSDAAGLGMQDDRRMLHAVYRVGMYPCPAQKCDPISYLDRCAGHVLSKLTLKPKAGSFMKALS